MAEPSLSEFTYENIPPLPEDATQPGINQMPPIPGSPMTFAPGAAAADTSNGIPLFELVSKRLADGSFVNVEFVSILTPGDPKSIPRKKVTDSVRERYRQYYMLWKQGLQQSPVGTPLEMWPIMTPAQVHELKALNIFTVEQLADVSEGNIHSMPMGITLRNQARDWLESKQEADLLAQRTAENQALKDGQDLLRQQIEDLNAALEAIKSERVATPTSTRARSK